MPGEEARRSRRRVAFCLFCVAGFCSTPASDAELAPAAKAALAAAACWSVGATRMDTVRIWTHEEPTQVTAEVKCQAHMEEDSHPVSRYTRCQQRGGMWKCNDGYNALMLRPTNGPALLLVPRGISFRAALDLVPELAKLRNRVGRPAASFLHGTCTIVKSVPFKGAEQFDISCDEGRREITLTRDCAPKQCRVFLVDARDVQK